MRIFYILFLFFSVAVAQVDVVGLVLERGSDAPLPYVQIDYASGKPIDQADSRGRFVVQVGDKSSVLVFSKPGYGSETVDLADYADLLDVIVTLEPNVRKLSTSTVRESRRPVNTYGGNVPIDMLEDAAGMRFDITEHLAQLPGMSGQKDFSSDLSYNGSRGTDVTHYLGGVQVPNMRHLDIGFPGNLSVINPHTLNGLRVYDNPVEGPLNQGLAAAIAYDPWAGSSEYMRFRTAIGLTNREIMASGPFFIGDAFVFSFRTMSADVLENLGQKYFTEFNREAVCDGCEVKSREDNFDLSSWDLYTHFSAVDDSGSSTGLTFLLSRDAYAVKQDTSSRIDVSNSTDISKGSQGYTVVALNQNNFDGSHWHLGYVKELLTDTIRDTTSFRADGDSSFNNFLGGGRRGMSQLSAGLDGQFAGSLLGGEPGWALEYQFRQDERFFTERNQKMTPSLKVHLLDFGLRNQWFGDSYKWSISAGAMGYGSTWAPKAGLGFSVNITPQFSVLSGAAWRQNYETVLKSFETYESALQQSATAKMGLQYDNKGFNAVLLGFGNILDAPFLPEPDAFWHYTELQQAQYAWSGGSSLNIGYRTLHHLAWQLNIASVYGEYVLQNNRYLPWEANRSVDINTSIRWYPATDSLLSLIVTYRASAGQPLYEYDIEVTRRDSGQWIDGTRAITPSHTELSLYRTDVRLNLDLSSRYKVVGLDKLRFYLEANNIFSAFTGDWAKYLGGDNARQRSWVSQDENEDYLDGIQLTPWMAKGMGFFVQFGVEGDFSF